MNNFKLWSYWTEHSESKNFDEWVDSKTNEELEEILNMVNKGE